MQASEAENTLGGLTQAEWIPDWLRPLVDLAAAWPLVTAAIAIAIFYGLCKIAELLAARSLKRLAGRTKTELDDRLFSLLHRPVFPTTFCLGLIFITRMLALGPRLEETVVAVLATLIALFWLASLFPALRLVLDSLARNHHRFTMIEERTIPLFSMIGKLILISAGGYTLLSVWSIDPRPWLASAGIVGIAVGFAAKDTLANLFGGVFILADSPYKLGDFIILDTGERGRVTHIGIRSTRLLTRDDIEITLPNAQIANAKVINESGGPWEKERIRIKVGVAYGSDADQVVEVLMRIAEAQDFVCSDPQPRVRLRAFGPSSLDFELLCWIDEPVLRGKLSHLLHMEIYRTFGELAIEIPYSKQDVFIKEMPGKEMPGAAPMAEGAADG